MIASKLPTLCLIFVLALGLGSRPAPAHLLDSEQARAYRAAFDAVEKENWRAAERHGKRANHPLADKVLHWYELRRPGSEAGFDEIARFLQQNPDWPGQRELRERAESALVAVADDGRVIAWFDGQAPLTVAGRVRYAEVLLRRGDEAAAAELLRAAWIEGAFGKREARRFRKRFGRYLRAEDHLARLERLVWDGSLAAARVVMPLVDSGYRALAHARLTLRHMKPGVDRAISLVPEALRSHPGLVYERLRWRREKGRHEQARELLWAAPAEPARPARWWAERAIQVRQALKQGDITDAYRLARDHHQADGAAYAEAEWLAGWIALRFLRDRAIALSHFERMYERVVTPVSRARGAYWIGRAAEAMGRAEAAQAAFEAAAVHVSTYYGQLAAARLGARTIDLEARAPVADAGTREGFEDGELVQVVRLLGEVAAEALIDPFIDRLDALAGTDTERALIAGLAADQGRPDLAVHIARRARRDGVLLTGAGYPVMALPAGGPEAALVLAVIRQESAFDDGAVSPSGARGLMQIKPATARQTARGEGLRYSSRRLLADPDYNLVIGRAYLGQMLDRFGGSYVLALAAYNAGPSRALGWIRAFGDPRDDEVDVVDWVELIPFGETRNYVQRVVEGLQVYRWRLDGPGAELAVVGDLTRARRAGG